MSTINERLHELWKLLMRSGLDPVELQVDRYSFFRLTGADRPEDGSLTMWDGVLKWRNIPINEVHVCNPILASDVTKDTVPTAHVADPPMPRMLTICAKNAVGRITYFNDPDNPEDYR